MTSEQTLNWMDGLAHRLVHHAARRAPALLSERLEEEWLADMSARSGGFSRLRLAVGCCWATYVIAREHSVATVLATSSPKGHASFADYTRDDSLLFSRRTATFIFVASLHVLALAGIAVGVRSHFTKTTPNQIEVREIPRTPAPIDLPVLPEPKFWVTRPELPPIPKFPPIESNPPVTSDLREMLPEPGHTELPPSTPVVVSRVQGGPGNGFPATDDFYPSPSIRSGEQGLATVRACVDGKGRLTSDPTIVATTGSARLDQAALKLAKAGSGHYRATTEDGQPVNSCYPFLIRFNLRN